MTKKIGYYCLCYVLDEVRLSNYRVALLDKVECHPAELSCDYSGFSIGKEFVVGYGLDYAGYYRNLPYIGILKPEVYKD